VYQVLNRAVARQALFEKEADYAAFKRVLVEALQEHPTRLLSYAVMSEPLAPRALAAAARRAH
jgi:putative transposase